MKPKIEQVQMANAKFQISNPQISCRRPQRLRAIYWPLIFLLLLSVSQQTAYAQITGTTTFCVGANSALSDAAGSGGVWSSSATATATVNSTSGVVTGLSAGTASISYTVSGTTDVAGVTVSPLPDAGTISGPDSVCIGSSITLSDNVSGGAWSAQNTVISVYASTGVVTGNTIGSSTVTYTVTNSCGTASVSKTIYIKGTLGYIYTYAGNGTAAYTGDNGPAYLATLNGPRDLYVDTLTNAVYFCDESNNVVRKISSSGIITTIAGNGTAAVSTYSLTNGMPATAAELNTPNGVFSDKDGNVFISNSNSENVCKINPSGILTVLAGPVAKRAGFTTDGGPATAALLGVPVGILEDPTRAVLFVDQSANAVRKISNSNGTGILTTIVGSSGHSARSYMGDGGPGTAATLNTPVGITMDNAGNLYIADGGNNVIRKLSSSGIITTIAGSPSGTAGYSGDGGPATAALLRTPQRFAYDGSNNLYVSDQGNNVVRQINLVTNTITTIAGNGTAGFSGDGGPATAAELNTPAGIAADHFGNFYIDDAVNNRIRIVHSPGSAAITIGGLAVVSPTHICSGSSVTLTASNSVTGSVAYQWQKNGSNVGSNSPTYTDSSPSNGDVYRYIITVTPLCGSSFNDTSNSLAINVSGPVITPTVTNVSCNSANDGSITTTVGSGLSPYSYSWSSGETTSGISAKAAGTYTLTVTDGNACTAIGTYTITQPAALSVPGTVTNVSCYYANNGSITTAVTGGTAPYTYIWNNDATTSGITDLAAGIYSVTVTDNHVCIVTGTFTVTQPALASFGICGSETNVACNGGSSGSINTSVSGGTSPYTYVWSNSATGANLTGLAAGTYSVTITDANGCTTTASYIVTEPAALNVSGSVSNTSCGMCADGAIGTTVTGGTPGYTYVWSNGYTFANPSALAVGSYTVTVTDARSCTATGTYSVTSGGDERSAQSGDSASTKEKGSAQLMNNAAIKVYPNPTPGTINVEIPMAFKEATIIITDMTGKKIESRSVSHNDGTVQTFNLSAVARSIYFVKVLADGKTYTNKVVVQ